jgi:hypothetical protein
MNLLLQVAGNFCGPDELDGLVFSSVPNVMSQLQIKPNFRTGAL